MYYIYEYLTMEIQDSIWAIRMKNITEEEIEGQKELNSVLNDENDVVNLSASSAELRRTKEAMIGKNSSEYSMKKSDKLEMDPELAGNVAYLNTKLIELTETIQGQNNKMISLQKENNDLKPLKDELKTILRLKKKVSIIETQLKRADEKKFFDRTK